MRRASSDGVIIAGGLLVMRLSAFIMSVLMARIAGIEALGEFTLFIAVFMLASEIPHAFDTAYLRAVGIDSSDKELYESANIAIKLILTTVIGFLFYLFAGFFGDYFDSEITGKILIFAIVAGGLNSVYMIMPTMAQQRRDSKKVALLKPVFNGLVLMAMLASLVFGAEVKIDYVMGLYLFIGVGLSFWAIKQVFLISRLYSAGDTKIRPYLVVSLTLLVSATFNLVGNRLDVFFLSYLLSFEQLGIYGAALRLSIVVSVLTGVISMIMIPKAAKAAAEPEAFKRYLMLGGFFNAVQIMVGLLLLLILHPLIILVYGDQFLAAKEPAIFLVGQVLVTSLGVPFQALIQCGEKPGTMIYVTLTKITVSASLLYYLVPEYGVNGAAAAILLTTLAMTMLVTVIAFNARPKLKPI